MLSNGRSNAGRNTCMERLRLPHATQDYPMIGRVHPRRPNLLGTLLVVCMEHSSSGAQASKRVLSRSRQYQSGRRVFLCDCHARKHFIFLFFIYYFVLRTSIIFEKSGFRMTGRGQNLLNNINTDIIQWPQICCRCSKTANHMKRGRVAPFFNIYSRFHVRMKEHFALHFHYYYYVFCSWAVRTPGPIRSIVTFSIYCYVVFGLQGGKTPGRGRRQQARMGRALRGVEERFSGHLHLARRELGGAGRVVLQPPVAGHRGRLGGVAGRGF